MAVLAFEAMGFDPARLDLSDGPSLMRSLREQRKISVVVLTYNQSATIAEALLSVIGQKGCFELEIIVGDDCSTDGTAEDVERLEQLHPGRIRLLRADRNMGFAANLKRCLECCTGDFIAFCEGDDYWISERKLDRQLRFLGARPKAGMCFNWVLLCWPTGAVFPHLEQAQIAGDVVTFSHLASTAVTANFSCCLYRADVVRSVPESYYRVPWAADWLFNLHCADRAEIGFLRETLSVYRIHDGGQWSGITAAAKEARLREARRYCAQVFGPARGFDDLVVSYSAAGLTPLADTAFKAHLDFPVDGREASVDHHGIRVRGWAIHRLGKTPRVVIDHGGEITFHDLSVDRSDVVRTLIQARDVGYHGERCGFDIDVRLDETPDKYLVGLTYQGGEDIVWWYEVTAALQLSRTIAAEAALV